MNKRLNITGLCIPEHHYMVDITERLEKIKDMIDNSKQYMWVYRTGKHSERQIVIYDYKKSRSGDVPKAFLGDFSGYLHIDGYAGYNKLTKVKHCNCWAHVRRKIHEAIVVDSENSIARTGRDLCDKLFSKDTISV